jgi:hypothetical protein
LPYILEDGLYKASLKFIVNDIEEFSARDISYLYPEETSESIYETFSMAKHSSSSDYY